MRDDSSTMMRLRKKEDDQFLQGIVDLSNEVETDTIQLSL
jgi:hypothetical protein